MKLAIFCHLRFPLPEATSRPSESAARKHEKRGGGEDYGADYATEASTLPRNNMQRERINHGRNNFRDREGADTHVLYYSTSCRSLHLLLMLHTRYSCPASEDCSIVRHAEDAMRRCT
jgi:hypothetical protein